MVGRIMSAAGGHVRRSFLEHLFFIFVMVQPAKNNVSLQIIMGGGSAPVFQFGGLQCVHVIP
jgi:hypothetical protein